MNEGLKGFGMTWGWVINESYYPFKINIIILIELIEN